MQCPSRSAVRPAGVPLRRVPPQPAAARLRQVRAAEGGWRRDKSSDCIAAAAPCHGTGPRSRFTLSFTRDIDHAMTKATSNKQALWFTILHSADMHALAFKPTARTAFVCSDISLHRAPIATP